jgi:parallel beta-helix repeat protein
MKKIILFVLLFLLSIPAVYAFTPLPSGTDRRIPATPPITPPPEPCVAHPIEINPDSSIDINNIFEHYADSGSVYYSRAKNEYQLCFRYPEGDDRYYRNYTTLIFRKKNDGRNVVIKGLKLIRDAALTADAYFLTVFNNDTSAKVVLDNIHLKDLKYGLFLSGTGEIDLINSELIGTGDNTEPQSCLLLENMNSIITNNDISNCYYGINIAGGSRNRIGAANADTFDAERNIIHDNKIGIYVQGGDRNKFSFNKIYDNYKIVDVPASDDAILYEPAYLDMLADLGMSVPKRPELRMINEETKEAMYCKKNSADRITERWLEFNPLKVEIGDEIIIYETNISNQALNYFTTCVIRDGGKCILASIPSSHRFSDNECTIIPSIKIVALINNPLYTSMLTEKVGDLRGPVVAVGVSGLGDVPAPAFEGVVDETGEAVSDEDLTREAEGAAAADTGTGGGAIFGKSGGCGGGGGATIVPPTMDTIITGLGMWWIITAVPVVIMLLVRIKRRK